MPYLKAFTNDTLDPVRRAHFLETASRTVAQALNKPEKYMMVALEDQTALRFAGSDAPCCYLEMKSIGFPENDTGPMARMLCDLVQSELGIPPDRTFIEFVDVPRPMWGWDGKTF
ncbi:MAG: hypothetical protein LJE84_01810 [Gammaproteobacteria bacterium]|jgi:phenylpyruvate tautomerase PptA (4-oxalocrotonate tautomerase family)|nr:hypothetical protein [Gammaproteobacteria bacterium]